MLLQKEENPQFNTVNQFGEGFILVNHQRFEHSICFLSEGSIRPWPIYNAQQISTDSLIEAAQTERVKPSAMDFLAEAPPSPQFINAPEIIVIGTGQHQRFLDPMIVAPFLQARIGVEVMNTRSAAHTYTILVSEGRKVAVALIVD